MRRSPTPGESSSATPRSRLHYPVLAAPLLGIGLLVLLRFATEPDLRGYGTHEQLGLAPCRFRDWLGGPCPTCGVTTSASHLVRGEFADAWTVQPLGAIAPLATVAFAISFVALHLRGADLGALALRRGATFWVVVAALVGLAWLG